MKTFMLSRVFYGIYLYKYTNLSTAFEFELIKVWKWLRFFVIVFKNFGLFQEKH